MFLLESTWLALTVWASEYGPLLAAVALAGVQSADRHRTSVGA